ncbi:LysM peptidoglycan-binding domain-containing protein [Streptomyces sp. SM12]|uniref:LysM peptidoglycan-binding domain-containing protein n=1 Tax=Streptomyces sp. SM12 TaxID=1071602 RepID=UPI000CD4B7A4|nr:LysM peptidoglycan-binding domain-containing protein [Streptomyces sp. SM12]
MYPPSPARPARNAVAGLLRAAVSLVALLALLAGVPAALLRLGTLPSGLPTLESVWEVLSQPDDGTVLVGAASLAGWVLWLLLVGAVVVEAAALARRRTARRRRGLGGLQQLAAWLLGGLVALSAPAVATAASAPPAATQELHQGDELAGDVDAGEREQAGVGAEPVYTVPAEGGTLWGIAEQELHQGQRATDLAALNPGVEAATDASGVVRGGTELLMPGDWTPPADTAPARDAAPTANTVPVAENAAPPATESTPPATEDVLHVVQPGDSLWSITDEHRGDPEAWPEVYQANRDIVGENPNLILPGQEVTVPTVDAPSTPEQETTPQPEEQTPDGTDDQGDSHDQEESQGTGSDGAQYEQGGQEAGDELGQEAQDSSGPSKPGQPSDTAPEDHTDTTPSTDAADNDSGMPAAAMVGGGAALAAGVVGLLAHKRRRQQARRRKGHRIARPAGRTARTEQALRHTQVDDQIQDLQRALRTAALRLTEAKRPLPDLAAVTLTPDQVELYLSEPCEPVPPFTTADEGANARWQASYGVGLADDDALADVEAPYPGLVSIGNAQDGALALVDLEHVGVVQVTGLRRREMVRTLAVELSVSGFADHLELALVGAGLAPALEQLGVPERLKRYEQITDAARVLGRQHEQQLELLQRSRTGSLRQARAEGALGETWSPLIVMADSAFVADPDEESALQRLVEMVLPRPRAAAAIVTSGAPADADTSSIGGVDGVWVVPTDGSPVTVPGTELAITPQPLTDDEYAEVVSMMQTAETGLDVPALAQAEPFPGPAAAPAASTGPAADEVTVGAGAGREAAMAVPSPASGPSATDLIAQLAACGTEDDDADAPVASVATPPGGDVATDANHADSDVPAVVDPAASDPSVGSADGTGGTVDAPSDGAGGIFDAPVAHGVATEVPTGTNGPATTPVALVAVADTGPMIRVLGPVDLARPRGNISSERSRPALETAAWIALHPDTHKEAMDEDLWPGQRVRAQTRNPRVSNVRSWLGCDPTGDHYFPFITGGIYRFKGVQVDWHIFQQLAAQGAGLDGEAGEEVLRTALALVRGRPFAGVQQHRYAWAEHMAQDMISAIVDVADDLADRYLDRGDARGALWAATKGLAAAPEAEQLHRTALRAHHALGDREGLERAARTLEGLLTEWQVDMQDDTARLLHELLTTPARPVDAAASA